MTGKLRGWLLLIGCLVLIGPAALWQAGVIHSGMFSHSGDTDAIYEALFQYIFNHNASGVQQRASGYFLLIEENNPTRSFLERFAEQYPPVEEGSKFQRGKGLLFHAGKIEYIDADTVEVGGGYYEGQLSAAGYSYKLSRQQGKWKVVEAKLIWIS